MTNFLKLLTPFGIPFRAREIERGLFELFTDIEGKKVSTAKENVDRVEIDS